MKKTLFVILAVVASAAIRAQSLQMKILPDKQKMHIGDSADFILTITANNFDKQIFISLVSTDLPPGFQLNFPKGPISYPYQDLQLKVKAGNIPEGIYQIILKAGNGPVESMDTLELDINLSTCFWQPFFTPNMRDFKKLYIDKKDNVWVAGNSFNRFKDGIWTEWRDLPSVNDITEDNQGNIWFATGSGVFKFDGDKFTGWSTLVSDIPDDNIQDIEYFDGAIWLTTQKGVARFDGTFWTVYNAQNSNLPSDDTRLLKSDGKGKLWMSVNPHLNGSGDDVLYTFNGNTWSFVEKEFNCLPTGYSALWNTITDMDFDSSNELWFTQFTQYATVARLGARELEYWSISSNTNNHILLDSTCKETVGTPSVLSINVAKNIFVSSTQDVWIAEGSPYGAFSGNLVKLNAGTRAPEIFNAENSTLPEDYIGGIAEDSKGQIWVATTTAICMYNCNNQGPTAVSQPAGTEYPLLLSPMPANEKVRVQGRVSSAATAKLSITNASGAVVYSESVPVASETLDQVINVSGLTPGFYILKVLTANSISTEKLIIE